MNYQSRTDRARVVDSLVQEVISGEIKRDHLINSSADFSGETQAEYFSNARRFMQSTTCEVVFKAATNTNDLILLKRIKGEA